MLVDKKILTGGLVMIAIGIVLSVVLNDSVPIGEGGMTEEQKLEFLLEERENSDYTTLSGILFGVGFLLVLISFGARRKKKGGAKKTEKKPAT
jgi:preprotein translocase subunit SecG|tara:strand:+ start:2054 stop:2332 length:279 start_codon:yes stop_codon:yes gene_type:complete